MLKHERCVRRAMVEKRHVPFLTSPIVSLRGVRGSGGRTVFIKLRRRGGRRRAAACTSPLCHTINGERAAAGLWQRSARQGARQEAATISHKHRLDMVLVAGSARMSRARIG